MMRDETDQILDDWLSRWHAHCKGYRLSVQSADPMFRQSLRAKGEQTIEAIAEDMWLSNAMRGIDFQVSEMKDPFKAAIYINARNCYTGHNVWISPRLPAEKTARDAVVQTARAELIARLLRAGIM